jgi:hypothetical protein
LSRVLRIPIGSTGLLYLAYILSRV